MPDASWRDVFRFLHLGTELAVLVGLGAWGGYALDRKLDSAPWCLLAGSGLGFTVGLYNLVRATAEPPGPRRGA